MVAAARLSISALALVLASACAGPDAPPPELGTSAPVACTQPENPYDEDEGHSAGFEWAKEHGVGSCSVYHQSVIEGCAEFVRQSEAYAACQRSAGSSSP